MTLNNMGQMRAGLWALVLQGGSLRRALSSWKQGARGNGDCAKRRIRSHF